MSEKENAGPTIPCFSEMFRFADDSDVTQHARELRAEAFAYGINLDLRIFPGAIPPSKKAKLPPSSEWLGRTRPKGKSVRTSGYGDDRLRQPPTPADFACSSKAL